MDGKLVRFSQDNHNLVAFISHSADQNQCSNALVLIAGLGEGFLSLAYTVALSLALQQANYCLVLVNLSSSWSQYGFRSLSSDARELGQLLPFLKTLNFEKIVLLGHSTGAQDVLYFLRYSESELTSLVNGIILQGAVSDRESYFDCCKDEVLPLIAEAKELLAEGKGDTILSRRLDNVPITAYRLHSFTGRLTDDDMFSTDLTSAELEPILQPVKVPAFLSFSEQDQYVPDIAAQKEFALRMTEVLMKYSGHVECRYYQGDHGLTTPEYYKPFVKDVVQFVLSL